MNPGQQLLEILQNILRRQEKIEPNEFISVGVLWVGKDIEQHDPSTTVAVITKMGTVWDLLSRASSQIKEKDEVLYDALDVSGVAERMQSLIADHAKNLYSRAIDIYSSSGRRTYATKQISAADIRMIQAMARFLETKLPERDATIVASLRTEAAEIIAESSEGSNIETAPTRSFIHDATSQVDNVLNDYEPSKREYLQVTILNVYDTIYTAGDLEPQLQSTGNGKRFLEFLGKVGGWAFETAAKGAIKAIVDPYFAHAAKAILPGN